MSWFQLLRTNTSLAQSNQDNLLNNIQNNISNKHSIIESVQNLNEKK